MLLSKLSFKHIQKSHKVTLNCINLYKNFHTALGSTPKTPKILFRQFPKFQISSSLKSRLEVKSQLKEFYKFTHPDLFSGAPPSISETNSDSIKNLNEFLRNISSENTAVENLNLTFYIKPDQETEEEMSMKLKDKKKYLESKGIKFEEASEEVSMLYHLNPNIFYVAKTVFWRLYD